MLVHALCSDRPKRPCLRYVRSVPRGDLRHILLLTDRDWTHPQAGGTGTVLYGLVSQWLAAGHRVTVIAGDHPGAERTSRYHERLTVHRMGTRLTVFPRAAWATLRGLGRDADVVLEVCNGIAFHTPLWPWLRRPRSVLVFHVHQDHYVAELGRRGSVAAFFLERLPLSVFYRGTPIVTISQSSQAGLVALGVPEDQIHVVYLGLEPGELRPGPKTAAPSLVYLGRLKQYKRIEQVLDIAAAVPGAHLHLAGEGGHRAELEAHAERLGISDRVVFHGHVDEAEKARLLQSAWLALTASSAEGWCLSVIEAAACATPTAALRVGGLEEAIVDGRTGVLADDAAALEREVRALVAAPERLRKMGAAALDRSRDFTWAATATQTLAVLDGAIGEGRPRLRRTLARSDSGSAAGLAAATLANNAIQLVFTIIFTRLLGASGYGSLAALVSAFLILLVAGQSVQVAAAREVALDRLGPPDRVRATLHAWMRRLLVAAVAVAASAAILREPLAALIGVPEHPWAAAAILPSGCLWLALSLQRGALQGIRAYRPVGVSIVGEALLRLGFGLALVGAGLGVTGALLGTPLTFLVLIALLDRSLRDRLGPLSEQPSAAPTLRSLIGNGWVAIAALFFLAALQNIDLIIARRELPHDVAGSYAAAAVAAKAVVFVAIGLGLQLLPDAARRAARGLDPLPVLARALTVLAIVAIPALVVFTAVPHLVLRVAFGPDFTAAAGALPLLALAMTLLSVAYLTAQYMIALHRTTFLWVLGLVAAIEPVILSVANLSVVPFATVVLGVQALGAVVLLGFGLRVRRAAPA